MKKLSKLAGVLLALCLTVGLCAVSVTASAEEAVSAPSLSTKTYTPEKYDFIDYYGGVGDINEEDGDGIVTFAHAAFTLPLNGTAIEMDTLFKLLSLRSVADGGDGVDGWVTYSFSATPGEEGKDNTYPYASGNKDGYYFHINNVSGSTAPNCSEWALFKKQNGGLSEVAGGRFFLDNGVDVRFHLSLAEVSEGNYTLIINRLSDGAELKKVENLMLDKSLFVNEKGQTYFSTAIYEGAGCDGNHWEHRGLSVYKVNVLTNDAADAEITLEQDEYVYEEGCNFKPAVTVKVGGTELVDEVDYYVEYANNREVGTASAKISFIGDYAGNEAVVKNFEIKEAQQPDSEQPSESSSEENSAENSGETADCESCSSTASASALIAVIGFAGALLAKKRIVK